MKLLFSLKIKIPGLFFDHNNTIEFFDDKPIAKQIGALLNGKFKKGKRISLGIEDEFEIQFGSKQVIIPKSTRLNQEIRNKIFILSTIVWLFEECNDSIQLRDEIIRDIAKTFGVKSISYANLKAAIENAFSKYAMKDIEPDERNMLSTNSYANKGFKDYISLTPNKQKQHPLHPFRN